MTEKKHWIIRIVPALAFAAGIIMSSIGGVMTLSSTAKLALFENGPYSYVSKEQCMYDYNDYIQVEKTTETKPRKRTDEDINICMLEKRAEEKQRFQDEEKQDIVDGLSTLFVGLMLVLFFRKRK